MSPRPFRPPRPAHRGSGLRERRPRPCGPRRAPPRCRPPAPPNGRPSGRGWRVRAGRGDHRRRNDGGPHSRRKPWRPQAFKVGPYDRGGVRVGPIPHGLLGTWKAAIVFPAPRPATLICDLGGRGLTRLPRSLMRLTRFGRPFRSQFLATRSGVSGVRRHKSFCRAHHEKLPLRRRRGPPHHSPPGRQHPTRPLKS